MNIDNIKSPKLFNSQSFSRGLAKSINIFYTVDKYDHSGSGSESDSNAIYRDWKVVADDLLEAIQSYERKRKNKPTS